MLSKRSACFQNTMKTDRDRKRHTGQRDVVAGVAAGLINDGSLLGEPVSSALALGLARGNISNNALVTNLPPGRNLLDATR